MIAKIEGVENVGGMLKKVAKTRGNVENVENVETWAPMFEGQVD